MRRVILHSALPLNDHGHASERPQIRGETECARPLPQGRVNLRQGAGPEFGPAPRPPGTPQRGPASAAPRVEPPHNALATHAEPARDRALRVRASGEQPGRTRPTYFHALEISSRRHVSEHTAYYGMMPLDVTLFGKDK